jgi:hypothetical protein
MTSPAEMVAEKLQRVAGMVPATKKAALAATDTLEAEGFAAGISMLPHK